VTAASSWRRESCRRRNSLCCNINGLWTTQIAAYVAWRILAESRQSLPRQADRCIDPHLEQGNTATPTSCCAATPPPEYALRSRPPLVPSRTLPAVDLALADRCLSRMQGICKHGSELSRAMADPPGMKRVLCCGVVMSLDVVKKLGGRDLAGGSGRCCHAATAGSMRVRSSRKGAIVSRVM
jgi:hypothetical protein